MEALAHNKRRRRSRFLLAAVGFCVLAGAVVALLSALLVPKDEHFEEARETIRGSYVQPRDSVEVIAIGASTIRQGFSPMYLYENYGISSYNYATSAQPPIATYYLLKDAVRLQGGSAKTVLLDAAPFVKDDDYYRTSSAAGKAEMAAAYMDLSREKVEFLLEISDYYDIDAVEMFVPILRYHSRWNDLQQFDYSRVFLGDYDTYTHGQSLIFESNATRNRAGKYTTSTNEAITEALDADPSELEPLHSEMGLRYLERIVSFCNEKGLDLVLVKTPESDWDDVRHDAVTRLANQYQLPFVDMCLPDALQATGFSYDRDCYDQRHANVIGGEVITGYLGEYLASRGDYEDARGDARYGFLGADAEKYSEASEDARLALCADLGDYLDMLDRDRYTVFVSADGESADGLQDETRARLEDLGLKKLSKLSSGESYVGILDAGKRMAEQVGDNGGAAEITGSYENGSVNVRDARMQDGASFDRPLRITSIGKDSKARADIVIDGEDQAEGNQGLNFVVYNRLTGRLLDTSSFDTHAGTSRSSDLL